MAQVEFQYKGLNTIIQCDENEKITNIIERFSSKAQIDKNIIYFTYDGKSGYEFNKELTFIQMANLIDKERKKMNILVNDDINDTKEDENTFIKSKNIICPKCGENIKIKIENYKITLYECKNKHEISDLSFDEFENTQKINLSKIICNECNLNNKYNTYNNEFYKCYKCNKNLCPICKSKHNKDHNIINYDKIKYLCGKHNEIYINYCNSCKVNICTLCEDEHKNHEIIYLKNIMPNKNDLLIKLDKYKKSIDKFQNDINDIIKQLNNVKDKYIKYYEIIKDIFNNYDIQKRNYETLFNLNELSNNNIIENINEINNESNIINKFNKILKINNIINIKNNIKNNEVRLTIKIEKEDINKNIYFLDNTNGKFCINGKREEHHHDFLKEFNESNVELYI